MLTQHVIGRKINRWIVIFQEFDLDSVSEKSKNSLVFAELISELLVESGDVILDESPTKGDMFFITSSDPWYNDILVYLKTLTCPTAASHHEHHHIHHQAKNYLILEDTLYH
jgi:hypothetical protein